MFTVLIKFDHKQKIPNHTKVKPFDFLNILNIKKLKIYDVPFSSFDFYSMLSFVRYVYVHCLVMLFSQGYN